MRRSFVLALAAVAVAAVTGCGSSSGSAGRPAASPTPDQATVWACQYAKTADETSGKAALKAARSARGQAALSDVAALREIAEKNDRARLFSPADDGFAIAAALSVRAWCVSHGVG